MAFAEHPSFSPPPDQNIKIWRYMSFPKFLSMLDSRSLYFSHPGFLGDAHEGTYSHANYQQVVVSVRKDLGQEDALWFDDPPYDVDFQRAMISRGAKHREHRDLRHFTGVNCWHMNNYESVAMWKIYAAHGDGIAVQSTYSKLRDSVGLPDGPEVHIGTVTYDDYVEALPEDSHFNNLLYKRTMFDYERELRAMCMNEVVYEGPRPTHPHGWTISTDLDRLIEAVYLAPQTPGWLADLVKSSTQRFCYANIEVRASSMDAEPIH